jgi:hypothetical protein
VTQRDSFGRVFDTPISVQGDQTVSREAGTKNFFALQPVPVSRDYNRERMDEVWRKTQKSVSFFTRFANTTPIHVLEITNTTVYDFETVCGGRMTKVDPFDECHGESPQRRMPGRADAEDAATDYYKIVLFLRQRFEISFHETA